MAKKKNEGEEVKEEEKDLEDEIMADLENLDKEETPAAKAPEAEKLAAAESEVEAAPAVIEEAVSETQEGAEIELPAEAAPEAVVEEAQPTPETIAPPVVETEAVEEEVDEEEVIEQAEGAPQANKAAKPVMDAQKARNILEAALFVAGRPVSVEELQIKTDLKKKDLEASLKELSMEYLERASAIEIVQMGDKYSMQIKAEYTQNVKKFASGGLIPEAVLKTLTIIALKQPMMKSMLIKIRGSTAYDHVKFLLDRGFVESNKKGRTEEITTTDQFADTFGVSRDIETMKKQMIAQLGIKDDAAQ